MNTLRLGDRKGTEATALAAIILAIALSLQLSATSYEIGEIPDQRIWYGDDARLEFQVAANALGDGAAIEMSVTEADSMEGSIIFDAPTGLFTYIPSSADRDEFEVCFTATLDHRHETQCVNVIPMQTPTLDVVVFDDTPKGQIPDPGDRSYIDETTETIKEAFKTYWFNAEDRNELRSITITGHTVIFEENHPNELWKYHGEADIHDLTIHADTLIIRNALHLPQTNVAIYARELIFEDKAGQAPASLNTTPMSSDKIPAAAVLEIAEDREILIEIAAENGREGHNAGSLAIYAQEIQSPGAFARIILNGGNGQAAGQGADGRNGENRTPITDIKGLLNVTLVSWSADNTIYAYWDGVYSDWANGVEFGPEMNAIPPKAGGIPGPAGNGGNIETNLELRYIATMEGGIEGTPAMAIEKTTGGTPRPALHRHYNVTFLDDYLGRIPDPTFKEFHSKDGDAAPSRSSDKPIGASGQITLLEGDLHWLSPMAMEKVLIQISHAYQRNHFEYVEEQLELYVELIELATLSPSWEDLEADWSEDLLQILDEMRMLLYRVRSNLDYFGNPAGWVPMLSFEINKIAFENEIERALRVMYLNYWLTTKATDMSRETASMKDLRAKLADQIESDRNEYGIMASKLPGLEHEASEIESKIAQTKADIEALKLELLAKAKSKVLIRKSAVVLGGLAEVIPVGQPVVGIAGAALAGFASADPDETVNKRLLAGGVDAFKFYASHKPSKKADVLKKEADKVDLEKPKDTTTDSKEEPKEQEKNWLNEETKKQLRELQDPIMDLLKEGYFQVSNSEAPSPEVEAELERILADTPEFEEMVEKVTELNLEKVDFAIRIAQTMHAVARLSLAITRNLTTIDSLNREIDENSQVLDPRTVSQLEVMKEQARARLLKYHYFMARAFEYRMLQPYQGDLDLNAVYDRFETLATGAEDHTLSPDQFDSLRAVYEDQISDLTFKILDRYNSNRPSLSAPIRFSMRGDLLDAINAGDEARFNFYNYGLFLPEEENLRIIDLKVIDLEVEYTGNKEDISYADIEFQHAGESILNRNGESYLFRHYNEETLEKIEWSTRFFPSQDDLYPIRPAASDQSLLKALLTTETKSPSTDDLLLYSRPAARADLAVNLHVNALTGSGLQIRKMWVELTYDFTRKDPAIKTLRIADAQNNLRPPVRIEPVDLLNRKDGETVIERSYDIGTTITIEVPEVFGHYRFAYWDGVGPIDADDRVSQFKLAENSTVRPVYRFVSDCSVSVLNGAGSGTYLEGETIELQAHIPEGHRFVQWNGAAVVNPESPNTSVLVMGDMEVSAITAAIQAVWLEDISTRARVGLGSDILITGFVIEGVVPKTLLIRAVGPTLSNYEVGGFLEDPTLSLFREKEKIATNDDWSLSDNRAEMVSAAMTVGAFPLAEDSKDAAILTHLDPGAYTVKVSGINQTTGVSLVEVYDVEPDADGSRLVNISGRAQVGTGANILIPGFVVDGSTGKKYLIRAIGPSLSTLGVTGALEDPKLAVFQDKTEIATNDNWGDVANFDELRAASVRVGAFELNPDSADAAVYLPLDSGRYTIKVSGVGGTTGVALVEIYEVEQP